ncbi:MAG TPA: 3-dehydroquinate synthase [Streptosporangiaceae bacterium]
MSPTRITVGGERPYDVVIGAGVLGELPALAGAGAVAQRECQVAVIFPVCLAGIAAEACRALVAAGYRVHAEEIPDGEAAKEIAVAARLWSRLAFHRIGRSDCIVGIGGGAACDLAGFVAATWLRGIRAVLVPTTLLGMVDAAIGGKTAINIPEGKNLVGAFHPPAGVLADLDTLASLPKLEYISGLAEVIKAGFIADPTILELIESDPPAATGPGGPVIELVERAVRVKAAVVAADLREAGPREFLNYGHTLAHAIERVEEFGFRHGEAVSIGMAYAAALGRLSGRLDEATAARHCDVLAAVGLPITYRDGAWPRLRSAMAVDKKTRGSRLRFVVLDGLGRPAILADPAEELLEQAYREVCL